MTEITKKSTKDEIFTAYQRALQTIQELEENKSNPFNVMIEKNESKIVAKADQLSEEQVLEIQIHDLQKSFSLILNDLSLKLSDKFTEYNDVKEAIQIQEKKLKELFDIEKEAFSLVALVNAKKEIEQNYDIAFGEKKTKAEKELQDIIEQAKLLRENLLRELKEQKELVMKERKREEDEYAYEFNRKKQKAQDELDDLLIDQRRKFNDEVVKVKTELDSKEQFLNEKESILVKREGMINSLEEQISKFPEKEAQIKKETEGKIKGILTTEFEREKNFIKKEAEHEQKILQSQIDMLKEQLDKANAQNLEMSKKLDFAYNEIKEIATRTIDSTSDKRVVENLQRVISESKKTQ